MQKKKVNTKIINSDIKEFRKIRGVNYKIGNRDVLNSGEVFYFEEKDTWYILKNNKICWDIDENKYILCEECKYKIRYIIGMNNDEPIIGYSKDSFPNLDTDFKTGIYVWPGVLDDKMWLPSIGRYLATKDYSSLSNAKSYYVNKPEYVYYDPRAYTIDYELFPIIKKVSEDYESVMSMPNTPKIFSELSECFNNTSIGCEVETSFGSIPNQYLNLYGFRPVRDGSINGWEYINYPYSSSGKDLWKLYQFFDVCSKFTTADDQCSLHYHIGNVPDTKEFIVSIYTLIYSLQQELHQICLPYKKDARYLSRKRDMKDHCQALLPLSCTNKGIDLQQKLDNIVSFFNEDEVTNYNPARKIKYALDGRNKWETHARYYILNLIPILFKNKAGTVEFRLRHGTVNKYDSFYWLLICNALVQFASKKSDEILELKYKYELSDIILEVYPRNIALKLCGYIEVSKISYEKCKIKGDMYKNTYKTYLTQYASMFFSFNMDNMDTVAKEFDFLPPLTDIRNYVNELDDYYDYNKWIKSSKQTISESILNIPNDIFKNSMTIKTELGNEITRETLENANLSYDNLENLSTLEEYLSEKINSTKSGYIDYLTKNDIPFNLAKEIADVQEEDYSKSVLEVVEEIEEAVTEREKVQNIESSIEGISF